MTTLTEFLLLRIAEDEAVANVCTAWDDTRSALREGGRYVEASPARVLARCEADRRIVELHTPKPTSSGYTRDECPVCAEVMGYDDGEWEDYPCPTLRTLASIYAGHEDFDESWRP